MGCPWTGQYSGGVATPAFHVNDLLVVLPVFRQELIFDEVADGVEGPGDVVGFLHGKLHSFLILTSVLYIAVDIVQGGFHQAGP